MIKLIEIAAILLFGSAISPRTSLSACFVTKMKLQLKVVNRTPGFIASGHSPSCIPWVFPEWYDEALGL